MNKLREKMVKKLMKEENKNNGNEEIIENENENEELVNKYKDKELWRVGVICKL